MRSKWITAAMLAGLAAAPLYAQSVKAGIDAWQRADYASATAIWRPLAEKGDSDAAFNLGQAYRLGRGVPLNLGAAQTWLERAARAGHLDAQTTLGLLLFQNGNRQGGLRWLHQAADKGEPRALLVYGTALFNGDGIARDPVLGYAFVSRAAAQGLAPAKETLKQLDGILPLEQRKRGIALAMGKVQLAKRTPKPGLPAKPPPAPKPAPVKGAPAAAASPPAMAPSGGWRIQLGAFSQRSSAETLFRRLAPALAGRRAFYVPAGSVTRLQAGPFATRAAAQAACNAIKPQPCFAVAAK